MNDGLSMLMTHEREGRYSLPFYEETLVVACRHLRSRLLTRAGHDLAIQAGHPRVSTVRRVLDELPVEQRFVYSVFGLDEAGPHGLFLLPGKALRKLIAYVLGDPVLEEDVAELEVSEVEVRFARRFIDDLLASLERSWPTPRHFRATQVATRRKVLLTLPPEAAMVLCDIEIGTPDGPMGTALLACPAQSLREPSHRAAALASTPIPPRALPLKVEVVAELARLSLPLRDIRQLKVGDTFNLGPGETSVRANGHKILEGEAGTSGGHRCVRIVRVASL